MPSSAAQPLQQAGEQPMIPMSPGGPSGDFVARSTGALVAEYLRHVSATLRPATSAFYRYQLQPFALAAPRLPAVPGPILDYLAGRRATVADTTLRTNYQALSAFYRWAELAYGVANPIRQIRPPRKPRTVPVRLSDDEAGRILAVAITSPRPADYCLALLLLGSGLRIGEVASVRRSWIGERTIVIPRGKSGQREAPIPHPMFRDLVATIGAGDMLFPFGRHPHPMTTAGLQKMWRRMAARAGLTGRRAGPHAARHRFGQVLYRQSGDIQLVQWALGHADIETALIYARLEPEDALAKWASVSPIRGMLTGGIQLSLFDGEVTGAGGRYAVAPPAAGSAAG